LRKPGAIAAWTFLATLLVCALPAHAQSNYSSPQQVSLAPFNAIVPAVIHKANNNVGGATVKTLSTTITSTTAGNSLVIAVGAGEVVGSNIVLTVTDTNSDTCSLAATQAISTTFAVSFYYCPNITAANTAATATFSGTSSSNTTIAMQVWEVYGLITLAPQMLDATAIGTATGTALLAGQVFPVAPNDFAFEAFGVGTAAQTVTLTGTGTWSPDSGQINPASASGLFSFVAGSQWIPSTTPVAAGGTITSEPWVAVLALFRPVSLPVKDSIYGALAVLSGQQAVTASAAALATNATKNACVEALVGNTINVYLGPSGVSISTGIELPPGATVCWPVMNTNLIYVIASTTGASVSWFASN